MGVRSLFNSDTQYFDIDKNTRIITPPTNFKNFGVESDENSNRVCFRCPRYVGDNLDLTSLSVRVNYQNANNDKDQYIVTDVTADGENVYFSWVLSRKATAYKGVVSFIVCAVKTDTNGVITNEWNTTLATGTVLSGLEVEAPNIPEDVTDVVNQLLNIVTTVKTDLETASNEAIAAVKETEATAIEAVKNTPNSLFANAIKGNAKGAIVRADDVSPVEHTVSVKVGGKNIFDNLLNFTKEASTDYTFENGVLTVNGYYINKRVSVESGKTYTFSFKSTRSGETGGGSYIIARSADGLRSQALYASSSKLNATFTFVVPDFATFLIIFFYGGDSPENAGTATYSEIQLENSETATEYAPYIAPESVVLTRCGKNILGFADSFEITQTGLVISYDADTQVFAINGTPTEASFSINFGSHLFDKFTIPIGESVALSIEHISGTLTAESATNVFYLGNADTPGGGRNNWFSVPFPTSGRKINVATATRNYFTRTWLYIGGEYDVTFTDYKFKVQLEVGTEATEYERFKGVKYTPDESGKVQGMTSLSPNITILSDTNGALIECTYTKDTNVVIAELFERITALESEGVNMAYRPAFPFNVPAYLLIPTKETVKGVLVKTYPTIGELFYCSFKTYGGTEQNKDGGYAVIDTANIETWFRPDIKADCRIVLADHPEKVYEVIGEPENIEMRNQYVKFKVKRVAGGA